MVISAGHRIWPISRLIVINTDRPYWSYFCLVFISVNRPIWSFCPVCYYQSFNLVIIIRPLRTTVSTQFSRSIKQLPNPAVVHFGLIRYLSTWTYLIIAHICLYDNYAFWSYTVHSGQFLLSTTDLSSRVETLQSRIRYYSILVIFILPITNLSPHVEILHSRSRCCFIVVIFIICTTD